MSRLKDKENIVFHYQLCVYTECSPDCVCKYIHLDTFETGGFIISWQSVAAHQHMHYTLSFASINICHFVLLSPSHIDF